MISEKLAASSLQEIFQDFRAMALKGQLTQEFCKELNEAYQLRIAELATNRETTKPEGFTLMDHILRVTHESTFDAINEAVPGLGHAWRQYAKLIATILNTQRLDDFYAEQAREPEEAPQSVRHFRASWVKLGRIVLLERQGINWTAAFNEFLKHGIQPKTRGGFSQLVNKMSAAEWIRIKRHDHGVYLYRGRNLPSALHEAELAQS